MTRYALSEKLYVTDIFQKSISTDAPSQKKIAHKTTFCKKGPTAEMTPTVKLNLGLAEVLSSKWILH